MYLQWGSYSHANDRTKFTVIKKSVLSPAGRRMIKRTTFVIEGSVWITSPPNQAALDVKIAALETAYATHGQDLVFKTDGGTSTTHAITSSNTINGTRVVEGPIWAAGTEGVWGPGLEFYNRRSYKIVVEADEIDDESSGGIVSWRETLSQLTYAGPDFIVKKTFSGNVRQDLTPAVPAVWRQSGSAIGLTGYVPFPDPIFGFSSLKPYPFTQEQETPLSLGINQNTHFPSKWLYHFESASPLFGTGLQAPTI